MSVNSCVSRTIEYKPDEESSFAIDPFPTIDYQGRYTDDPSLFKNYAHDKFNAVLPDGSSFSFIIDPGVNGNLAYTISDGRNVKISCSWSTVDINSFIITDESGVKYTFSYSDTPCSGPGSSPFSSNNVSWLLEKIELPYSTEPIVYTYDYSIQSDYASVNVSPVINIGYYFIPLTETGSFITTSKNTPCSCTSYKMRLLSSISYGNDNIYFSYKYPQDTKTYNYLNKISIYEGSTNIRNITLNTSTQTLVAAKVVATPLANLDSVEIIAIDNGNSSLKYKCNYHPLKWAYNQPDYWGNLSNGSAGVGNFNVYLGAVDWNVGNFSGSDMSLVSDLLEDPICPDFKKYKLTMKGYEKSRNALGPDDHGVLYRLTYPTNGYSEFQFENHKFLSCTDENGDFIYDYKKRIPMEGGGFRIYSIINYNSNGAQINKKSYRYGLTNLEAYSTSLLPDAYTGVGEAVVDPNVLTFMSYSEYRTPYPLVNMILGVDPWGEHKPFRSPIYSEQAYQYEWSCSFSANNFRRLLNGRPPVLYSQVTVFDGDLDEYYSDFSTGKTVYNYTVNYRGNDLLKHPQNNLFLEYPNYCGNTLSYTAQHYLYNRLNEKRDYILDKDNMTYKLIKKEENIWDSRSTPSIDYVFKNAFPPNLFDRYEHISQLYMYNINYLGFSFIKQKRTVVYNTQDSIVNKTTYEYNNCNQIVSKFDTCSDGQSLRKYYTYPQLSSGVTPSVIQDMVDKNIISPVLKDSTSIGANSAFKSISSSKVDYNSYTAGSSTLIMPSKSYNLEITPTASNYALQAQVLSYSSNGNPLEFVTKDGVHTSCLWGYNDRYMIAEVKNASRNQVAFANFENTQDKYGWTSYSVYSAGTGKTGLLSGAGMFLAKTDLPTGNYKISFWARASSGTGSVSGSVSVAISSTEWKYYEFLVPNVSSLGLYSAPNIYLDDIRIIPENAQMTTYTHEPLIGITSKSEANGVVTNYTYDGFGRLTDVKDNNGNTVSHNEYHYRQ